MVIYLEKLIYREMIIIKDLYILFFYFYQIDDLILFFDNVCVFIVVQVFSYKNFKGTIEELSESRFIASGEVVIIDDQIVEITELFIRIWIQNYKEDVLEIMLYGIEKTFLMITYVFFVYS